MNHGNVWERTFRGTRTVEGWSMRCGVFTWILFLAVLTALGAPSWADIIVVTSEADSGAGTLRDAITQANGSPSGDTITFAANVARIRPLTSLPAITDTTGGVTIDGNRAVVLDGSLGGAIGLRLDSDGNTISGMIVVGFSSAGIRIYESGDNIVRGCWVGTDGVSADTGNGYGILLTGACVNNQIGGSSPHDRNVVSGNGASGVTYNSSLAVGNLIEGNYIGTDVSGTIVLGNLGDGVYGGVGYDNTIRNNVVSGSGGYGIFMGGGSASGNRIEGNIIGLNAMGTAALPNALSGVYITRAGNYVGGTAPGAGNVVSGNASHGIHMNFSQNTEIQGNVIGLGADGATPLGNNGHGILLETCGGSTIGGTVAGAGNTISANAEAGIAVTKVSDNVIIRGNRIGVTAEGLLPAGSQPIGVFISDSVNAEIGGATPEAGNVIAHHAEHGVQGILPNVSDVTVRQNSIHSNLLSGIDWESGVNPGAVVPAITGIDPLAGTSEPLNIIEIFADSVGQGRILVDTVQATPGGTFGSSVSLVPFVGLNLTATATAADGSTSEFSVPVLIDIPVPHHSADFDADNKIELGEVLRVIQFFNTGEFSCATGPSDDGYETGDGGGTACDPHDSDFKPQDWQISLSELLRLVQLFNVGSYHFCPGEIPATEDGYCPGNV